MMKETGATLDRRGRSEPMRAFEPLAERDRSSPNTIAYCAAFAKLEARDAGALPAFAALVGASDRTTRSPSISSSGC